MFRKIFLIGIVLSLFLVGVGYTEEAIDSVKEVKVDETPSLIFTTMNKSLTYDISDLSSDNGIHGIFYMNETGIATLYTVGVETKKVDELLLNKTFLKEEGYLTENEKVPVIISLNISEEDIKDQEMMGFRFGMEETEEEKSFEEAKTEVSEILESEELTVVEEDKGKIKDDLTIVNAISAEVPLNKIKDLAGSDAVKKIYLDRKVEVSLYDSVPLINATAVWRELDSSGRNVTGWNVTIAIIDTGIDYTHPDLGGCLGSGCKVVGGYDFVNEDSDPMDDHGHGTHVADTAAGNGTLKGVAPDAKLYGYKVLSSGGWGYWSWVISGIQRATDPNNDGDYSDHVDIISMSLGGSGNEDDVVSSAVDIAVDRGVVVVSAAGNSGTSTNAIGSPGSARKGIAVAATDKSDNIASFSSRGPTPKYNLKPDLVAPGVSICAAQWNGWYSSRQCYDNRHISISGTSMATPHVSGAAALLLQKNPTWSPEMIKSALMSTTKDLGYNAWTQGTGRLNVSKALSPLIVTYPVSISFGQVSGSNLTTQINITNLNSTPINVSVVAGLARESGGANYNVSYIVNSTNGANITSFVITPNTNATVNLTINLGSTEGTFYGYINITTGGEVYRVPYAFIRLSTLTVTVRDFNNNALNPIFIYLHNNNLTYTKYVSAWDMSGGSYTFTIPADTYTVHAIGDYWNYSLTYILTNNVTVSGATSTTLSLSNSRAYNVTADSITNDTLDLYKWQYLLADNVGSRRFSTSMTFLGFGFHGDRIVYITDTDNDTASTNISLSYMGYPYRENKFNEWSYSWAEKTFTGSDELYLMGWILENTTNTTNTILNYTSSNLGIYNYSYEYPGNDPHQDSASPSYNYNGIIFWISPAAWFDFSGWYAFPASLNKTVYIKGDPTWGYWHYTLINYMHGADWIEEFVTAVGQMEDDKKVQFIWPYGVRVNTGDNRILSYGKAPYMPTSFDNSNNLIRVNKHFLSSYNNETYVYKYYAVSWWSSSSSGVRYMPIPVVSIYDSTNSLVSNQSSSWTGFSYSVTSGQYTVNITIPPYYPISNTTVITAKFNTSKNDKNPPLLAELSMLPRFEHNKPLSVVFNITDTAVDNVSLYYKHNQTWYQITLTNQSNQFNTSITINDTTATELDLKIFANDTSGNQINYTILPAAMLGHNVSLNFVASSTNANKGNTVTLTGRVIDATNNKNITGVRIAYYLNGTYYDFDKSEIYETWSYNSQRGWYKTKKGDFGTSWTIPSGYTGATATFTAVFNGTGIYLPNQTTITISINTSTPQYSNLIRYPSYSAISSTNNVIINVTWTSTTFPIDIVWFESNYSVNGIWSNYTVSNISSVYNYTIHSANLTGKVGQAIGYRFIANNTGGIWNTAMPVQTFVVQSAPLSITTIVLSNYNNSLGWGETWRFTCNVLDSENDALTTKLWSKSPSEDWELKGTNTTSVTANITSSIIFSTTFNKTYVGSSMVKCNVTDTNNNANETTLQVITVEKDDVNLTVTAGNNETVQRYGTGSINLVVTIYDADKGEHANTNGTIYVTNDGSIPYDINHTCLGNSRGNCSYTLDPESNPSSNNHYGVGIQYFVGEIFSSDSYYKFVNSSQANFTVLGTLFSPDTSPSGYYNKSSIITLNTSVTDDTENSVSKATVYLEYKRSFEFTWRSCTPVNETIGGNYSCVLNTSDLETGFYDINYLAEKSNYTGMNNTVRHRFMIVKIMKYTTRANFTANQSSIVNATNVNTTIEIMANRTLNNTEVNITFNTTNPVGINLTVVGLEKYLTINISNDLASNLSYAIVKVNYTDEEVNNSGINESSLRLYRFNSTEWVAYNNQSNNYIGGVSTGENFVWGNVTQFSDFGVGGLKPDGQSCTSNSECNSGNCAVDYDGDGKWCATAGNCAHDYNTTTYTNGYTLCSNSSTRQACGSGTWSASTCAYGCSNGVCGSAPTTTTVTTAGGGVGIITPTQTVTNKTHSIQSENVNDLVYANLGLRVAVEKITGALTENALDKLSKSTSEILAKISEPSRTLTTGTGTSTLSLSFKYTGKGVIKNLIIYDVVPKSFVNSSDDVTITASGAIVNVIDKDPVYSIAFAGITTGQKMEVNYTVKKNVDTSVLNVIQSPIIVAEKFEEEVVCIQVITTAINPETNECREFPTPCDVPANWTKVEKCPVVELEVEKPLEITKLIVIAVTLLMVVLIFHTKKQKIKGLFKKRKHIVFKKKLKE